MFRWIPTAPADKTDSRAWHRARHHGWVTEDTADRLLLRHANIQLELVYGYHPEEYGPEQNDRAASTEPEPEVRPLGRSTT
jgi:hypothetical protein